MAIKQVVTMLPVHNVGASIAFYERLGFAVESRRDEWGWAMLIQDGCRLMIDESISTHPDAPRQGVTYLYPDDIEAFHRRALEAGIDAPEPNATFYGMREFRIEDPDGNRLWIGQTIG